MGANNLYLIKLAVLGALLASCAALSPPLGEHDKKVATSSRFLEEEAKTCCNCACGASGQCGAACSSCDCDGCCGEEAEEEKAESSAEEHESEAEEHESEAEEEEEHEKEEEGAIKFGFVLGLMALAGTFIFGYILEHHEINWMPEAGVGVIMGVLVSAITTYGGFKMVKAHEQFDFEFFMVFLLPPIIFDAGYNMDVKAFIANIGPTMFFAFIGTFGSTFVVGGAVYYAGQQGWCYPLSTLASLTFGSLISATDPVTVLAVFSKLGVHVDLFSMVFGESVLNDAVAIVLSRTILSFNVPGLCTAARSTPWRLRPGHGRGRRRLSPLLATFSRSHPTSSLPTRALSLFLSLSLSLSLSRARAQAPR